MSIISLKLIFIILLKESCISGSQVDEIEPVHKICDQITKYGFKCFVGNLESVMSTEPVILNVYDKVRFI